MPTSKIINDWNWVSIKYPSTAFCCRAPLPKTTVEPVSKTVVRSGVSGQDADAPRPNLSLLQRSGTSPGLEALLLGESASQETGLRGTNKRSLMPMSSIRLGTFIRASVFRNGESVKPTSFIEDHIATRRNSCFTQSRAAK